MSISVITCEDKDTTLSQAVSKLAEILQSLKTEGRPVLLLLSGGSALKIPEYIGGEFLPLNLTISVLDDRFSADSRVNNFAQLMNTKLYKEALTRGVKFIDTRPQESENVETLAERIDKSIKDWRTQNPNGAIIITQGVGPDGHTTGVMPFPEDEKVFRQMFLEGDKWVVGYNAEGKNEYPLRITATLKFLKEEVSESVVLMTGQEKKEAFERVFAESGELYITPARIIRDMKRVTVFTDIKIIE